MMNYLLFYIGLLIICIVIHELGHYLCAKRFLKRKAIIVYDGKIQTMIKPPVTEQKELRELLKAGIIFGFIPMLVCLPFFPEYWVVILLVAPVYAVGCRVDIKMLKKIMDEEQFKEFKK